MSKIEWTGLTWNPIVGCAIVSPGCKNCYAMRDAWRKGFNPATPQYHGLTRKVNGHPVWTGEMRFVESALTIPLRRKTPTTWFVNSMSDLFAEGVTDAMLDRIFAVMALSPQHTFQVLTKRPERMRAYLDRASGRIADTIIRMRRERGDTDMVVVPLAHVRPGSAWWPLPNVWLGVSAEDQTRLDERIPELMATLAAVRFLSAEPLLGPLTLTRCGRNGLGIAGDALRWPGSSGPSRSFGPRLDWVIVGGESGPGARPMHPDWARRIRNDCADAGVPFFFKQWGNFRPSYLGIELRLINLEPDGRWERSVGIHSPRQELMADVGKRAAGRLLDGVTHDAMPERAP